MRKWIRNAAALELAVPQVKQQVKPGTPLPDYQNYSGGVDALGVQKIAQAAGQMMTMPSMPASVPGSPALSTATAAAYTAPPRHATSSALGQHGVFAPVFAPSGMIPGMWSHPSSQPGTPPPPPPHSTAAVNFSMPGHPSAFFMRPGVTLVPAPPSHAPCRVLQPSAATAVAGAPAVATVWAAPTSCAQNPREAAMELLNLSSGSVSPA